MSRKIGRLTVNSGQLVIADLDALRLTSSQKRAFSQQRRDFLSNSADDQAGFIIDFPEGTYELEKNDKGFNLR